MPFNLAGYRFKAAPEQFRAPQVTRIALVQHSIVEPTDAPFTEQRGAIHARITQMLVRALSFPHCTGMQWWGGNSGRERERQRDRINVYLTGAISPSRPNLPLGRMPRAPPAPTLPASRRHGTCPSPSARARSTGTRVGRPWCLPPLSPPDHPPRTGVSLPCRARRGRRGAALRSSLRCTSTWLAQMRPRLPARRSPTQWPTASSGHPVSHPQQHNRARLAPENRSSPPVFLPIAHR